MHGGGPPPLVPPAFQGDAHGVGLWDVLLQGLGDRGLQFGGTKLVKEIGQIGSDASERNALCCSSFQQLLSCRNRLGNPIRIPVAAGSPLLFDQGLYVCRRPVNSPPQAGLKRHPWPG